jgi:hypothetical protein
LSWRKSGRSGQHFDRRKTAIKSRYKFGVSAGTVTRWRQALPVPRCNEGPARLHTLLNREKGEALRGRELTEEQANQCSRTALTLGLRPRPWRWRSTSPGPADRLQRGGVWLDRPTHVEVRDGKF